MILLATSPRRLGRAGHVELLLLLGDVGQDRAQALVLDNRGLVDLRPFVEGAIREIEHQGIPIYRIAADDPTNAAAVREVDLRKKYRYTPTELAEKLKLNTNQAKTLR